MKLTPQELIQAEALSNTHEVVEKLLSLYKSIESSGAYESYVTRMVILSNFNQEVKDSGIKIINSGDDIDVHDKAVDRVMKFLELQPKYLEGTKIIQAMLTPQEQESANKEVKKNVDLAF